MSSESTCPHLPFGLRDDEEGRCIPAVSLEEVCLGQADLVNMPSGFSRRANDPSSPQYNAGFVCASLNGEGQADFWEAARSGCRVSLWMSDAQYLEYRGQ